MAAHPCGSAQEPQSLYLICAFIGATSANGSLEIADNITIDAGPKVGFDKFTWPCDADACDATHGAASWRSCFAKCYRGSNRHRYTDCLVRGFDNLRSDRTGRNSQGLR